MTMPAHVRSELAEQRQEWWQTTRQIAAGVFIALVAHSLLALFAVRVWIELELG
jgi:hypothetical protein